MNEPACRAYRAAILPTVLHSCPNPKFNTSLTLTLLLQTPRTLNYRRAARHPNRLRSPFCTKTRSSTLVQHTNNKSTTNRISGVWALITTAAYIGPSDVSNDIHTSHHRTDGAHARRRIQFPRMCVIHCRRRDGRVGSAPPPTPPARLSRSE